LRRWSIAEGGRSLSGPAAAPGSAGGGAWAGSEERKRGEARSVRGFAERQGPGGEARAGRHGPRGNRGRGGCDGRREEDEAQVDDITTRAGELMLLIEALG